MSRWSWTLLGIAAFVGLVGCNNFFEGGVTIGVPTVQVARANFSSSVTTDQNNNKVYKYQYDLLVYSLRGSGPGYITLLDKDLQPVFEPISIPEPCPVDSQSPSAGPCGPYVKNVTKSSVNQALDPVIAVKYKAISLNGRYKVVDLPAPIELY